eukprot:Em0015g652a
MSRILCDHVEFFKMSFEDVVEKHIKHEYYEEMSMKSIVDIRRLQLRGRGAQKAKVHELSPLCTLSGLIPVVADWHTKVKLLEVIWRYFYSPSSQGDHGTLYQLRNKLNRCNVIKTPKNDVNACEDFLEIVTAGLVVAAALATFRQASTNDYPNESVLEGADIIWTLSDEETVWSCIRQVYNFQLQFL